MPSSYVDSVPGIMKLIIDAAPKSVLDVGPGWGKYGLMCREYLPNLNKLWAVEVPEGRLCTQDAIYHCVIERDVLSYLTSRTDQPWPFADFEIVLLIDVIEHMSLDEGHALLRAFMGRGSKVIVATPKVFVEQHDDHNPFEEHKSLWAWEEFASQYRVKRDESTIDSIIYLLSK